MTKSRAVVFDLDDTLFPERAFACSGFEAVAAAFAETLGPENQSLADMRRLFDSDARPRVFNALLAERDFAESSELVSRMVRAYREHIPRINLYADANRVLTKLRAGYNLGLISDGPALTQKNKISALSIEERLDQIILTDESGDAFHKPSRGPFELMAEQLGVPHGSCVYVADNPAKDFIAPNTLGWLSVRILRDEGIYRDVEPPPNGRPTCTIKTLDDLASVMARHGPPGD